MDLGFDVEVVDEEMMGVEAEGVLEDEGGILGSV